MIALLFAMLIDGMLTNDRYQWDVVGSYVFSPTIMQGLGVTLILSAMGMVFGIILGTILAVARLSSNPIMAYASWFYIWLFRSIPLLVQLIFWYNLTALYPHLALGVPFGPQLIPLDANTIITAFVAAVIGFSLHEAAYMAEIVRSGMNSVGAGQSAAATALGLTRMQILRFVVLPQAMRVIIPTTGNRVITMVKNTSLVSVISLADILYSAQLIYSRSFQVIPLLLVACIWYLILVSVLSVGQHYLEARFNRGVLMAS